TKYIFDPQGPIVGKFLLQTLTQMHEVLIYFQSNLKEATFSPPLSADPPEEKN
ncbi:hypothetical protein MKX03_012611, partial [Papaver bracteatum]